MPLVRLILLSAVCPAESSVEDPDLSFHPLFWAQDGRFDIVLVLHAVFEPQERVCWASHGKVVSVYRERQFSFFVSEVAR